MMYVQVTWCSFAIIQSTTRGRQIKWGLKYQGGVELQRQSKGDQDECRGPEKVKSGEEVWNCIPLANRKLRSIIMPCVAIWRMEQLQQKTHSCLTVHTDILQPD